MTNTSGLVLEKQHHHDIYKEAVIQFLLLSNDSDTLLYW